MFRVLLLTCVISVGIAAPVQLDSNKTLDRTKRSEEAILYGNHQNFARMKKGELHPHPLKQREEVQNDEEESKEDSVKSEEQLDANDLNLSADPEQHKAEQTMPVSKAVHHGVSRQDAEVAQIEKLLMNNNQVDPITALEDAAEEERILQHIIAEEKGEEPLLPIQSEGLPIVHPDQVLGEEEATINEEEEEAPTEAAQEERVPSSQDSESTQEDNELSDYATSEYDPRDDKRNDMLLPRAIFKRFHERNASPAKSRRSLPIANAEDMMTSANENEKLKLSGRVKRELGSLDLTPGQVDQLFKRQYMDSRDSMAQFVDSDYDEEPLVERRSSPDDERWSQDFKEDDMEEMSPQDIDLRSYGSQMYLPENDVLAPYNMAGDDDDDDDAEDEKKRLQLLEYLYSQAAEPQFEQQGDEYPGDFEESWNDLGPVKQQYEPEGYNGVEEPEFDKEIPNKRQYLSFVPGLKRDQDEKREFGEGFYPYQYGPDSRWGAMVPNAEREKRSELAEYQRLYELAQALNGPDTEQNNYEKRFDGQYEPSQWDDYWNRK